MHILCLDFVCITMQCIFFVCVVIKFLNKRLPSNFVANPRMMPKLMVTSTTTGKTCPVKDILTRIEFQQRLKGMKANGLLSTGGDRCSGNPIDAILLAYNCTMCTEVNAVDLLLGF